MAKKHAKEFSTFLHIETTGRPHCLLLDMVTVNWPDNIEMTGLWSSWNSCHTTGGNMTFVQRLWKIGILYKAEHVHSNTQKLSSRNTPNRNECLRPPKAIYKNDRNSFILNNRNWKPATGSLTVEWKNALRYNLGEWHISVGEGDLLHALVWMDLADEI